jgi:hypothetical protein
LELRVRGRVRVRVRIRFRVRLVVVAEHSPVGLVGLSQGEGKAEATIGIC